MLLQVRSYLKYLLSSTNLHGIHSPFVFRLVKDCIYDPKVYDEYGIIRSYRKKLYSDSTIIPRADHGAGSKKTLNTIKDIASVSSSGKKKSELLFRLSRYFKCREMLELGTNLGVGTLALALGNPQAVLTTIDADGKLQDFAKGIHAYCSNVKFLNGSFNDVLPGYLNAQIPSLVFIDGDHRYASTMKYFRMLKEKCPENVVLIFDDINWSEEMQKAFEEIRNDNDVSVTIDLYTLGLVFLREGQVKQNFVVRF